MSNFLRLFRDLILSGSNDNSIKLLVNLGHLKEFKIDEFSSVYSYHRMILSDTKSQNDRVLFTIQPIDGNSNDILIECSQQFKSYIIDFLNQSLQRLIIDDRSFNYLVDDFESISRNSAYNHGVYSHRKRDHNLLLATLVILSLKGALSNVTPDSRTRRGFPFNSTIVRLELSRTTTPLLIALIISITNQLKVSNSRKSIHDLINKPVIKKFINLLIQFIDEDYISFIPEYFTTDLF